LASEILRVDSAANEHSQHGKQKTKRSRHGRFYYGRKRMQPSGAPRVVSAAARRQHGSNLTAQRLGNLALETSRYHGISCRFVSFVLRALMAKRKAAAQPHPG
jgi:hypothetical protein